MNDRPSSGTARDLPGTLTSVSLNKGLDHQTRDKGRLPVFLLMKQYSGLSCMRLTCVMSPCRPRRVHGSRETHHNQLCVPVGRGKRSVILEGRRCP